MYDLILFRNNENIIFQFNGVPGHFSNAALDSLYKNCPNSQTRKEGSFLWPSDSPVLINIWTFSSGFV